jgi:Ulp1 family protease
VHFFTSHFLSTLEDDGPEGVASWTRNKKKIIDVFEKKFIFVPVNSDLHWSLCVVVNPGHILKAHQLKDGSLIEFEKDGEWPW